MKPEEILSMADEYKSVVKKVLKTLNSLGPDLTEFVEPIRHYIIKSQCNTFTQYTTYGFSREEALILTLGNKIALQDALNKIGKK